MEASLRDLVEEFLTGKTNASSLDVSGRPWFLNHLSAIPKFGITDTWRQQDSNERERQREKRPWELCRVP